MKLRNVIFLLVTAAVLSGLVAFAIFRYEESQLPPNTKTMPYRFSVAEHAGVDVGTDMFRLGAVPPGSRSHRVLHIADSFVALDGTARNVTVRAKGQGSQWLVFDPPSGVLPLDVNVTVHVPPGASHGTYEGMLLITVESLE